MQVFRVVACAAVALYLLVSQATAQELQTVKVGVLPILDVAPFYAAVENNFFAEEGLKVEVVSAPGSAPATTALVSGSLDVAYNNVVTALLARSRNLSVKMIAPGTNTDLGRSGLIVRKADKIDARSGLEGKTVAVNVLNNTMWLYARAWMREKGVDPSKVTFREVPFPQMNDALRQKQVDAIYTVEPFQMDALRDAEFGRVANPNEIQPDVITGVYLASDAFIQRDGGKTIQSFLKAMKRGIDWYNARLESQEVTDLIVRYSKINAGLVSKLTRSKGQGELNVESIRKTAALMKDEGLLRRDVDIADAIYLPK